MFNLRKLCFSIAIPFGIFMFVYGGWDDSPGAQGLGLLFVIYGVVKIVRHGKNKNTQHWYCATPDAQRLLDKQEEKSNNSDSGKL